MGACLGKLQADTDQIREGHTRPSTERTPPRESPALVTPQLVEKVSAVSLGSTLTAGRESPPALTQLQPTSVVSQGTALAQTVASWEEPGRLQSLSSEQLIKCLHSDNVVLLETLDRLEKSVKQHSLQAVETGVSSRLPSHSRGLAAESPPSSEDLSPATPVAEPTVHKSGHSGESGCYQQNRATTPSPPSALHRQSLRHMLQSDPLVTQAVADFKNGKVLKARSKLERWCQRHFMQLTELEPYSTEAGLDVHELLFHCRKAEEMLRVLQDESDYSVARDDGDLRVLYKCEKGRIHHIKMDAVLPYPLEWPLSLAREFDLMSTWNAYVKDSSLLHAPSIWESWVYAALWMPFPFPQIDALATGRGYDLSEEDRSLLVTMESVAENDLPAGSQPLPHHARKRKRASVMPGSSLRLEALPPGPDGVPRTKGTVLSIVDPHIPHVPAFIINFVLGVLAPFAHRQIKRLLRDEFGDSSKPFPRRIAAHPELYERVQQVVKEGLALHYSIGHGTGTADIQ